MSTADFEILAEMDRADALVSLAEMQHAAMLAKAMDVVNGSSVADGELVRVPKLGVINNTMPAFMANLWKKLEEADCD